MSRVALMAVLADLKKRCAMPPSVALCSEGACGNRCWLTHNPCAGQTVSADQVSALSALIAYVAHHTGRNEFRVEREFADAFCVPNVKCLPSSAYDGALRFLTAQVPAVHVSSPVAASLSSSSCSDS